MDKLISAVCIDNSEQLGNSIMLKELGHCIAYLVVDDFSLRIFPSSSQDNASLEESISKPFFVLCRSAFSVTNNKISSAVKPMSLLTSISKYLEATGFLVLYFLRGKYHKYFTKCMLVITAKLTSFNHILFFSHVRHEWSRSSG